MKEKIQKTFVDHGFGFPVKLIDVPMVQIRGQWTPNIDYNELALVVLHALCFKDSRLTGNQVKFIRQHFEMTLKAFAERFYVTHPAVIKWEKKGDSSTEMSWETEKDIRLFILLNLGGKAKEMVKLYNFLEAIQKSERKSIEVDLHQLAT